MGHSVPWHIRMLREPQAALGPLAAPGSSGAFGELRRIGIPWLLDRESRLSWNRLLDRLRGLIGLGFRIGG